MRDSIREAYARLSAAQKGRARGAPGYSVFVNRPVGRVLAAVAYRLGATPNQVTGVSALFTFAAIGVIATVPPTPLVGVVVWFCLALGYALDSADGQVARLRGGGSLAGEWLDHFVDSIKSIALHLAVAIGAFQHLALDSRLLLIPLGFALVSGVTFFGMILNDLLKGKVGVRPAAAVGGFNPWRSLLLLPTDYGLLCTIFLLWGFPSAFLVVYTLVFAAWTAFLMLAAGKWFREMSRLEHDVQR